MGVQPVPDLKLTSLRPFVPSGRDYAAARAFFMDLGFRENWGRDELCELQLDDVTFLLQNYHNQELQENLMMYVNVNDLDVFWSHLQQSGVLERYAGVRAKPPTRYPWGITEVHLIDPAGVCWHFAGPKCGA